MIVSFKCKETKKIYELIGSRKIAVGIQEVALRKLKMLNASVNLDDLRIPPANRLESLKGRRKGQFSIRINDQWRICFTLKNGNAYDLEIVDYH